MLAVTAQAQDSETARNRNLRPGLIFILTVLLIVLAFIACLSGLIYSIVRYCRTKKQIRQENAEIKRNMEKMENYLTKKEIEAKAFQPQTVGGATFDQQPPMGMVQVHAMHEIRQVEPNLTPSKINVNLS